MAEQKPTDSWISGQSYNADGAADQKDKDDALKRSRAALHQKNKTAKKTRLQIPLDIRISALDVIKLDAGWGPEFAGNWIVDDHMMKIGGTGLSVSSLNLHKCLGYPAQNTPAPPATATPTTSTKPAQTVAVGDSGSPTPLSVQLGAPQTFVNPATGNIENVQPTPGPGAGGGQSVSPPGGD
jgi:hypothetical protein